MDNVNRTLLVASALGIGAGLMFYLDPERGQKAARCGA